MPQDLLKIYDGRSSFWQWDTGQKIIVLDRTVDQLHFSNSNMNCAVVKEVYVDNDGVRVCDVPDTMLEMSKPLIVYAYVMDDDENRTICAVRFSVSARPIPEDYIYEVDENRFKDLVDKIESVEDTIEKGAGVKKFNSLSEAEAWAQDYKIPGTVLSVYEDFEWAIYMVGQDYSLEQIGDLDQLIIDVDELQRLVGKESVEEQIRVAILSLDLPNTYDPLGAAEAVRGELAEETKRAQNEEAAITRELHKINNNISDLQGDIQKNKDDASAAIKAITDDYLKKVDKTELEDKIKSNTDAIALLTNGVDSDKIDGVNDLIKYVDEHGAEVTGMKASIKSNTDAIAKEKSRAEGVETALDRRLKAVEDMDISSKIDGFVSYKAQELTEAQKAQARKNIGAIDKSSLEDVGAITTATDDEIIDMLIEIDMIPVVQDSDGSILADENNNILLW